MSVSAIENVLSIDENLCEKAQVVVLNENISEEDKGDCDGNDGSDDAKHKFDVNMTLLGRESNDDEKQETSSSNSCLNNNREISDIPIDANRVNNSNSNSNSNNSSNNNNNPNNEMYRRSSGGDCCMKVPIEAAAVVTLSATPPPTQDESENNEKTEKSMQQANGHLGPQINVFKDNEDSATAATENGEELNLADFDESMHPLTERWSPLGADYDEAMSPIESDVFSPESELELLSLSDSPNKKSLSKADTYELSRLQNMEDEQEMLTTSLLALTSHFAHVQLRVRQIVEAPSGERDELLKALEEFAFRGIPGPISPSALTGISKNDDLEEADESAQERQCELIDHLKSQLSELEKLAYESGAPVLPQQILLEKQKIIIDELKSKLNLKVEEEDLPQLSPEELKCHVDTAIGEFVGPLKMKEQLVAQLKTQITDLERFIVFLQCDTVDSKMKSLTDTNEKFTEAYNSYAAKKKGTTSATNLSQIAEGKVSANQHQRDEVDALKQTRSRVNNRSESVDGNLTMNPGVRESLHSKAHGLLDKASLLMQIFATTHFGTRPDDFQKNTLKKTSKGNHWGDLRAQLEVDIQEVASLAATLSCDREKLKNMKRAMKAAATASATSNSNGVISTVPRSQRSQMNTNSANFVKPYAMSSDSEEDAYDCYDWTRQMRRARFKGDSINAISRELTIAVRKNFCVTLQRLIQHGLRVETSSAASSLIVPFMRCLNPTPVFAADHASGSFRGRDYVDPSSYSGIEEDGEDSGGFSLFNSNAGTRPMHAWELILEYYYLKHGDDFNNTPARKLSESFKLDIVDTQAMSAKQNLLSTIGMLIAMHRPYKRSFNAHFKAFVCAGLNCHQLVDWLNLILSCTELIETYYTSNSYVVRTGFRDTLISINALMKYDFDLPVDLAIRHFKNI